MELTLGYIQMQKLDYISYDEMIEMSSLGANVIATQSIIEIGCKYHAIYYCIRYW